MQLIDGKLASTEIKKLIRKEVDEIRSRGGKIPHLAAVLVGENPASQAYVRNKVKACEEVGFESTLIRKDASISQLELLEVVRDLNNNPDIDGYIVQLPLPKQIRETDITLAIDPKKDVDGFHPVNFGRMAQGLPSYLPATPFGILKLLEFYKIPTKGKHCVVLGRSNIVGTPISLLLSRKHEPGNCTVTIVHSASEQVENLVQQADILVAAIGIPRYVQASWIKEGAVVIDVGINRVEKPQSPSGFGLVGDVDFDQVAPRCSAITPVPGGVGPMTVTALLLNTLSAARKEIYS